MVPEGQGKGLSFSCRLFTKCQDRLRKQVLIFLFLFKIFLSWLLSEACGILVP